MNKKYLWIIGLLVFIALIWAICGDEEKPVGPTFSSYWGDENAEVIAYSLTYAFENRSHTAQMVSIWQAQTFSRDRLVVIAPTPENKTEQLEGMVQMTIKNTVSGMVPFHFMTVNYFAMQGFNGRPAGAAIKTMFSSQDWMGAIYEQLLFGARSIGRTILSSKTGDLTDELARPEEGVTEEELPLFVMGLAGEKLSEGETKTFPYLPSLEAVHVRGEKLRWQTAEIRRGEGKAKVKVPAGKFKTYNYQVIPNQGPTIEFFVDVEYPHRIVRYEKSMEVDGKTQSIERAEMTGWQRVKYWEKQNPGDEKALKELGLKK